MTLDDATFAAVRSAVRAELIAAQARLAAALDSVGPPDWARPSPNEGWSVRELLGHLATAEAGFVPLLRRMASGGGGVPDDFDPNRWNSGQLRRQSDVEPRQLRADLEAAHRSMLELVDGLDAASLEQRG